jgi:zinc-binding alcohol dehydrogenase family protein
LRFPYFIIAGGIAMKAVGYYKSLPIDNSEALLDIELPQPQPAGRDLLVEVKAISVNPVDTKLRKRITPPEGQANVLGYDAAGVVIKTGADASLFKVGDEVWYAGQNNRPGSNAEFQLVDERIVGKMPSSLSFAEAAALPLTGVTAWEMLFDRLALRPDATTTGTLLVIGGAGGVGSIMIQLARQLTGLTVIATASRPETQKWVLDMGAHFVIDHSKSLLEELKRIGIPNVQYVASLTQTSAHYKDIVELLAPQGKLCLIDDPDPILDINLLKRKSITICWEFMFTRSAFQTPDIARQGEILNELKSLVDAGKIRSTYTENFGPVNAVNLKKAHTSLESGSTIGKIVLEWKL